MKEECVELQHHRDVGETIAVYQKTGWRLHSYQAASLAKH